MVSAGRYQLFDTPIQWLQYGKVTMLDRVPSEDLGTWRMKLFKFGPSTLAIKENG